MPPLRAVGDSNGPSPDFRLLLIATLAVVIAGCQGPPPTVAPEAPKVTVMHPEQRELSDHEEFNGWMAADETVEVRSRVRGHISRSISRMAST